MYAGSKAALEAMTWVWSRELAERATVNAVNPDPAWREMYEKAGQTFWEINQPYVGTAPLASYHMAKMKCWRWRDRIRSSLVDW